MRFSVALSGTVPSNRPIGTRVFTDGVERPVFADADGQYVVDGKERIDGVWLAPEDEPEADVPIVVSQR